MNEIHNNQQGADPGFDSHPRCTICNHIDRAEIEAALVAGSIRAVAARFGISRSSLQSHRASHMPEAFSRARRHGAARLALNGASIARRLEQLHADAFDLFTESRGVDFAAATRALAVMQRQAEFAWRVSSTVPAGGQMTESRFEALAGAVLRVLEPHPDLRLQIAESLREIEARFPSEDATDDTADEAAADETAAAAEGAVA